MPPSMLPSSWAASGLIHASAFGALALGAHRAGPPVRPAEVVEFRMDPAPVAAPKEVIPPPPEPAHAPAYASPQRAAKATNVVEPVATKTTSPAPLTEAASAPSPSPVDGPLDFTGSPVGENGSFAMVAGSGGGSSGGGSRARPVPAATVARPSGPTLTRREELSRPPSPPDLSGRLLASYPSRAKAAGDSGSATLSLVVLADGQVTSLEVRNATSPEFGRACVETVRGSRWQSPLDKNGQPTGTRVGYTCTFDVR